jgi:hypothetical protein
MHFVMENFFAFSLKQGSSLIVCDPTMAGKSTFVHSLLKDKTIFNKPPSSVYWFYGGETAEGLEKKGYIVKKGGLPDSFKNIPPNSVVVLDDLMDEAKDHAGITALFTKLVPHKQLFVIHITKCAICSRIYKNDNIS